MRIIEILDAFNTKMMALAIIFLWILVGLIFFLAIALNFSYVNSQLDDLSLYCFAFFVLLSFSYTLRENRHVRIDLLYAHFSKKTKQKIWLFVNLLCVLPFSLILIVYGLDFAIQSYNIAETSPNGRIPYYFIFKFFMVFGFVCLALQSIGEILKAFFNLKSHKIASSENL